ncbi:hypothetical protein A2U01_0086984, partial [Trifolium medium]|nr:hypothetical protein [Trifolium medium]
MQAEHATASSPLQNATTAEPGAAQTYSVAVNWKIQLLGDSN